MRDFQLQTPQRDKILQISGSKRFDLKRNPRKTAKKSRNPVVKADSEDDSAVLESPKEFSEASDCSPFAESAENFLTSVHPTETQPSEPLPVSDLTSTLSSTSVTATPYKHDSLETTYTKILQVDSFKTAGSVEAEVVINHLREARLQVLKSKDAGPQKKLVEALINIVIEEFHGGLYKENEWLDKLLFRKFSWAFLVFIPLLMVWFLDCSSTGSFPRPTPT
ncbi:hypothetical protein AAHA92_29795 [Salvia divinorum]|uniref:Uncharacterized protein n=1 Tax=Salvia divinorum TaxID=28513 RepID=A0ABD1FZK0_SALDI